LLSLAAPIAAPLAAAIPLPAAGASLPADDQQLPKLPPNFPKLSDQSRAEVEARLRIHRQAIRRRFNDQQRAELRRLSFLAQPALDNLRAYTIHNGDSPALYLKPLVEREKKPPSPLLRRPPPRQRSHESPPMITEEILYLPVSELSKRIESKKLRRSNSPKPISTAAKNLAHASTPTQN